MLPPPGNSKSTSTSRSLDLTKRILIQTHHLTSWLPAADAVTNTRKPGSLCLSGCLQLGADMNAVLEVAANLGHMPPCSKALFEKSLKDCRLSHFLLLVTRCDGRNISLTGSAGATSVPSVPAAIGKQSSGLHRNVHGHIRVLNPQQLTPQGLCGSSLRPSTARSATSPRQGVTYKTSQRAYGCSHWHLHSKLPSSSLEKLRALLASVSCLIVDVIQTCRLRVRIQHARNLTQPPPSKVQPGATISRRSNALS